MNRPWSKLDQDLTFEVMFQLYRQNMKISDKLNSGGKPFPSMEIVPPLSGISKEQLLNGIEPFMEFSPAYINVTRHRQEFEFVQNPDGTFTRCLARSRMSQEEVCRAVKDRFDIEVVPHIICAGVTKEEIRSELKCFEEMGIANVVALRGDCTVGEKRFTPAEGGYAYASELVEGLRRQSSEDGYDLCIAVGGYPEKHFEAPNIETDIANLKKKVDAGADYIITQMFFDNAVYYDFVDRCRAAGITVPIVPGLKPLSTVRQLRMLPETFSLDIPLELTCSVNEAAGDAAEVYRIGTQWCKEQCRDLIRHGVPAVHFYTMGASGNVVEILESCF